MNSAVAGGKTSRPETPEKNIQLLDRAGAWAVLVVTDRMVPQREILYTMWKKLKKEI